MSEQSADRDATWPDDVFYQRFREVLERLPTLQMAAEISGFSPEQIAKWRDGKARPPLWPIRRLAEAAGRSMDWLCGQAPAMTMSQEMLPVADEGDAVVYIPLLEVIASAGPGIENMNPVAKDYLPFPRRWLDQINLPEEHARFLDSRGDSMTDTIKEDAICLADTRWQSPRLDAIFVVVHNNDVRIKRIGRGMEGRVTLISDNPRYETETLSEPEARSLTIAGRIVWSGGKI